MRSVCFFVAFLALVALALSVSAQPPPRHESIIILFNDSACTQHLRTERVFEQPSTKCEPEETPRGNFSNIFECDTANNVTHLINQVYNNTLACDNTPIVAMTSAAPAHTCAAISVTFEGQKALLYGHVECAPPNMTSTFESMMGIRQAAAAAVARSHEPQESVRSIWSRIFGL